jgi:thymidine kinase
MKLHYIYSAMAAGKSSHLLQVAFNYRERGHKVFLYTAAVDDRSGVGRITSRLGLQCEALVFDQVTVFDLTTIPADTACVLIDEAQFLTTRAVEQLHQLAHVHNIAVMCWGLRSDFQGKAFEGSAALLTLADSISETKTICDCGKKASMNARIDDAGQRLRDGPQLLIGGNNRYRALCPECFYRGTPTNPAITAPTGAELVAA